MCAANFQRNSSESAKKIAYFSQIWSKSFKIWPKSDHKCFKTKWKKYWKPDIFKKKKTEKKIAARSARRPVQNF